MYKLVKPAGHNTVITVENTATGASIKLGRVTVPILSILHSAGYTVGPIPSAWELEINEATKDALVHTAMIITKPHKDKDKNKEETPAPVEQKKAHAGVDMLDILLGLKD